jgi:hypothetical protein
MVIDDRNNSMSVNIEKLAKEATSIDGGINLEEFAKLIIQECRNVITDFDGVEDYEYILNPRSVRWDCDCEIRDHFELD